MLEIYHERDSIQYHIGMLMSIGMFGHAVCLR